jgi:citrate synthase
MLNELATVDRVRPFMEEKIQKNEKIMGLGHRVYKTKDPRAMILQSMAKELLGDESKNHILKIAEEVENVAAEKLAAKGVYPNVDFYSGIIYSQLGIASDLFTPVFAVARTSGWLAHWLEQLENNRIYRPTQIYDGEHDIPYSGVNS